MKFLVDMPLSPTLALWLQERGHDAVHALDLDLGRASDETIIDLAQCENRIVVTADLDYPRLLALSAAIVPSIILFRGGRFREEEARDYMARLLDRLPEEALLNCIVVVDKQRIRRRPLPL